MLLLNLARSVAVSVIFFALLGLAYPLAETAIGHGVEQAVRCDSHK